MPQVTLELFIARWSTSAAVERANKDMFLTELCDALGVLRPEPATGDGERDQYVFEKGALLLKDGLRTTTGHVDLYKAGCCFVLEAKQGSHDGGTKTGTARRGTGAWSNAMQEAFGQALQYARTLDEAGGKTVVKEKAVKAQPAAWAKDLPSRIGAVRATIEAGRGGLSIDDVASAFKGARRADVESILESLSRLGLARSYRDGQAILWSAVRIA